MFKHNTNVTQTLSGVHALGILLFAILVSSWSYDPLLCRNFKSCTSPLLVMTQPSRRTGPRHSEGNWFVLSNFPENSWSFQGLLRYFAKEKEDTLVHLKTKRHELQSTQFMLIQCLKVIENLINKLSNDEMFLFYFNGKRVARHNTSLNRIPHSSAIPNPICWQICASQFVFSSDFSTFVCTQPRFQGFTKCVCLYTQCHSHLKRFLFPPCPSLLMPFL